MIFNERRILIGILAVAFLVRLAIAMVLPDQAFPDAQGYRESAQQIWQSFQIKTNFIMPLYPIIVGLAGEGWGQMLLDVSL